MNKAVFVLDCSDCGYIGVFDSMEMKNDDVKQYVDDHEATHDHTSDKRVVSMVRFGEEGIEYSTKGGVAGDAVLGQKVSVVVGKKTDITLSMRPKEKMLFLGFRTNTPIANAFTLLEMHIGIYMQMNIFGHPVDLYRNPKLGPIFKRRLDTMIPESLTTVAIGYTGKNPDPSKYKIGDLFDFEFEFVGGTVVDHG